MRKPDAIAPHDPTLPLSSAPPTLDLGHAVDLLFKLVEGVMALSLVAMVVMVLGNVILRYGFDTGLTWSEELSRTLFIWLTFIGAVVATRDGAHLGVDSLLRRLPRRGQLAVVMASEFIILACCVLLFRGTWSQHEVNATTQSLVTGMPMSWVFGVGYVTSVGIGVLCMHKIWRIATGRATDHDIFGSAVIDEVPAAEVKP